MIYSHDNDIQSLICNTGTFKFDINTYRDRFLLRRVIVIQRRRPTQQLFEGRWAKITF